MHSKEPANIHNFIDVSSYMRYSIGITKDVHESTE